MIDREELRKKKQDEWEREIAKLHKAVPRLGEIADRIAYLSLDYLKQSIRGNNSGKDINSEVKALFQERKDILESLGLDEKVYEPKWNCPICKDLGYVRPGVVCECVLKEKQALRESVSGIYGNLREKRFANFFLKYYNDPQNMEQKVRVCKEVAEKIIAGEESDNLLFIGDVGRGKTHLSLAIANEVLDKGKDVIYRRMNDLLEEIREAKYDGKDEGFLQKIYNCDLLVVDDFGAENSSDFAKSQIRILIEERNINNKPWIISTNLDLNMINDLYSVRIADRLLENTRVFAFDAPKSIREILREQRSQY